MFVISSLISYVVKLWVHVLCTNVCMCVCECVHGRGSGLLKKSPLKATCMRHCSTSRATLPPNVGGALWKKRQPLPSTSLSLMTAMDISVAQQRKAGSQSVLEVGGKSVGTHSLACVSVSKSLTILKKFYSEQNILGDVHNKCIHSLFIVCSGVASRVLFVPFWSQANIIGINVTFDYVTYPAFPLHDSTGTCSFSTKDLVRL